MKKKFLIQKSMDYRSKRNFSTVDVSDGDYS